MNEKYIEEFQLRLKAPLIALERIAKGQHLPKIFVGAALGELKKAHKLADKMGRKKKG